MRIAVQNPSFIFEDQKKNFNGYNYIFLKKYCSVIYSQDPRKYGAYTKWISNNILNIDVTYNPFALNKKVNVLMGFNGVPYRFFYKPLKSFHGIKIYHVMDYVFYPSKANKALEKGNVNYVMGYCDHYSNDKFFRKYYPGYTTERIIKVPFGFGERFKSITPFSERNNKAIALGSVNPVRDQNGGILLEYLNFHKDDEFTHKLRRTIVVNRESWGDCIDDLLPTFPETKNPNYDPVLELNKYTMFVNDAGLMNFPPARTYEGIAAGCVMVAEDLQIWKELGFVGGVNCILFEKGNYQEMINKIRYYQNHFDELQLIQVKSFELAQKYTHEKIADKLYKEIKDIFESE